MSAFITYVIQCRAEKGSAGRFLVKTSRPDIIAKASQQLSLPPDQRLLHVNGALAAGDGGFNQPWNWHIVPDKWDLVEMSIELCDGVPSDPEKNPEYWINVVKRFCPWSSYVDGELPAEAVGG